MPLGKLQRVIGPRHPVLRMSARMSALQDCRCPECQWDGEDLYLESPWDQKQQRWNRRQHALRQWSLARATMPLILTNNSAKQHLQGCQFLKDRRTFRILNFTEAASNQWRRPQHHRISERSHGLFSTVQEENVGTMTDAGHPWHTAMMTWSGCISGVRVQRNRSGTSRMLSSGCVIAASPGT